MARVLHLEGLCEYRSVHALQESLVRARASGEVDDTLILMEHRAVITVGRRRGARSNVMAPEGIDVVAVERGGDVTWHGPGQLVAYPIVRLDGARRDLHQHLRALEAAVIGTLEELGLSPTRDDRNTGVWLPNGEQPPRKVCSVGIACRHWVTWHGLALNVHTALEDFERIRPCGFDPDVMTRLADHLDPCPTASALAKPLALHLADALNLPITSWWRGPLLAQVEAKGPLHR